MKKFDYSDYCNQKLFESFPELRNLEVKPPMKHSPRTYREIIDEWFKISVAVAHGIYEDAFCYYILDLIHKNDKESRKKVKKAFELIEELANHEDQEVKNVAEVSFIEPFLDKIENTKDIEKYVLPKSLEMARHIGSFRFGLNPTTWEKEVS